MKLGIIGAGRIGQVHARSVWQNPDTTLVAVSDPHIEAAQSVTARYGGTAVATAEEVINNPEVEAIVICSPTPFHAEQILAAAKANKPALCEKPIAMDSATVEQLYRELEGLNPRVMMGFNRRFDPSFAAAKQASDAGKLGKVEQVTIISRDPAAPPKEYIAVSGGIFKDMTIHDFDMARFLIGDIASVSAVGQNLDPDLADTGDFDGAVITMVNTEGASATVVNSRHCATGYDQRLEIFGTQGSVFCENVLPTTAHISTANHSRAQDTYLDFFLDRYAQAYALELAAFVSAARGERDFSPSIADGAAALRIAEAAETSARELRTVTL
ncbi:inositol 2-dehydrogenase [Actinomycetaceae bacterium WB03_NA08]|uniref:Inositol 2-dehydrogenase n=1 Tax=Scrofimicrobium canadense TaxID=2652290 RepID=A0A6N7VUG5_9ACTO|nr:inositol 2-dehydrogenase [Scrofimicrobium canadense]MSS84620.1 inositol 2-dehydrogenase [Scrofimicrobium canadense]